MWTKWITFIKRNSSKTDLWYFILCIIGVILLAWILKNYVKAGDEVIAGISAALITLLGVNLTNKNSQIALDKQLKHQNEAFQTQLNDQSEGFKDQIKHQNELLERQMKHQSEENDKDRKLKFKHDQYIELVKYLSEAQNFFRIKCFLDISLNQVVDQFSVLSEKINISKAISSKVISIRLNNLHDKYTVLSSTIIAESPKLINLKNYEKTLREMLDRFQRRSMELSDDFFKYESNAQHISESMKSLLNEKKNIDNQIEQQNKLIIEEMSKINKKIQPYLSEIQIETGVIISLINIELGYTVPEDY